MPLKPGKIPHNLMDELINIITNNNNDPRLIIGPKTGQDVAIIDMGEKYLVSKTDPITFTTDNIGYYVVNINANDIVTSGAIPKWFQATVLLPEKNCEFEVPKKIIKDISEECKSKGIAYIGGHTEVTIGLDKAIVIGSMMGEVEKDNLITTMDSKPGDALMMTKGIVLEGSSIIATEKEEYLLKSGFEKSLISQWKNNLFNPGISVQKEASLLSKNFVIHSMHDPTEGGLANGVVELARNSNCGVKLNFDYISFLDGTKELCEKFDLDPLSTITSGVLIYTLDEKDVEESISLLKKEGISATKIGNLTDNKGKYLLNKNGVEEKLKYSDVDEITKIF